MQHDDHRKAGKLFYLHFFYYLPEELYLYEQVYIFIIIT